MRSVNSYQDIKTPEEMAEEERRREEKLRQKIEREEYLAELYRDSHDPYDESLSNDWED